VTIGKRRSLGVFFVVLGAILAPSASAQIAVPTVLPPIPTTLPGMPGVPGLPTSSGGGGKTAKITSAKSEGDLRLSAGIGVDVSGSLTISMAAIKHPDLPNVPVNPLFASVSVQAQVSGALALTCTIGGVSSSSKAPVDLVFINDTTGSMSGTVNGISESISKFADKVAAGGVDARYSMYTYGDAFATRAKPGKFTAGTGDFDPPSFDNIPRPYVALTDLGTFQKFLTEMKGSGSLGMGGGDAPENTLGALQYANRMVGFRQGAAHMFVVIGDNPSHQKGDGSSFGPSWLPPSGEDVVSELQGKAVAHVVGKDMGNAPYYNLKKLADSTGGDFKVLPPDGKVDLGSLGFDSWMLSGYRGSCTGLASGTLSVVLKATVVGKKVYTGTLTFAVVVG
jgi:hypothetical protein